VQLASWAQVKLQLRVLWQFTLQVLCVAHVVSQVFVSEHAGEQTHAFGHEGEQLPPWQVAAGVHTPLRHTDAALQVVAVVQSVPSFAGIATQACWDSLQMPVLHALLMLEQSRVLPPVHTPPTQCSPVVQNMRSSQAMPSCPDCWQKSVEPPPPLPVLPPVPVIPPLPVLPPVPVMPPLPV
jgi:hypothetical protein